jgi:hypothetical protein
MYPGRHFFKGGTMELHFLVAVMGFLTVVAVLFWAVWGMAGRPGKKDDKQKDGGI